MIAENAREFVQAVSDLLSDNSLFNKIRNNARKLVEEKYAWEKGVEVMEEVLEKMISKKPLI
jgi:glycosyltransferase involved in cell wall biosynthesis